MPESKKRTFESSTQAAHGLRLNAVTAQASKPGKPGSRGANVRAKNPEMSEEQRQELIYRLIDFLKEI